MEDLRIYSSLFDKESVIIGERKFFRTRFYVGKIKESDKDNLKLNPYCSIHDGLFKSILYIIEQGLFSSSSYMSRETERINDRILEVQSTPVGRGREKNIQRKRIVSIKEF